MRNVSLILFLLLSLVVLGCGDGKVNLGGKVTYSDDGTPLGTGTVGFQTETYFARGVIKEDGTYEVYSEALNDGLPPGQYHVYISGAEKQIGIDGNQVPIMEPLIDQKHTRPETSGLTLDVDANTKVFDIVVDRYIK